MPLVILNMVKMSPTNLIAVRESRFEKFRCPNEAFSLKGSVSFPFFELFQASSWCSRIIYDDFRISLEDF